MKYKIVSFAALLALLFTACNNNATTENSITTPHQKYIVSHPVAEDQEGLDFNATLELPIGEDEITVSIRKSLTYKMCGDSYKGSNNIQRAIDIFYGDLAKTWNAKFQECDDDMLKNMMARWEYLQHIKPIFQAENIVCYESDLYTYQGGAHGISDINYYVYDLLTSHELNDRDIYNFDNPETEDAINNLLKDVYAQRCNKDKELANAKLDEPRLNNNFTVTADSIIYLYNQYEIAAYSAGQIKLGIAKEALYPYLKNNTILYKYWKR